MLRSARLAGLLAVLLAPTAAAVGAQSAGDSAQRGPSSATVHADSDAIVRAARSAQTTFERVRRRYLPLRYDASSRPCGEVIGRFCYWDDDSTDDLLVRDIVPAESPRIAAARDRLLASLDGASAALPGDSWIAGLHVHYLIEAGRVDEAAARARGCRAEAWWCAALVGLAEHAAWRHAEADSAFSRALAGMPVSLRCEWTSLEVLLDEPTLTTYRRADCAAREDLAERIWWLADPSYLRAGNDRRTEHFARVTLARVHRRAASGYATTWRDDLDEIVRRFGWPSHFARTAASHGTEGPRISAHHHSPAYHFLPNVAPMTDPRALGESAWSLRPVQPRERYAPPWATVGRLTHQATLFRRGDSTLLVVAYDASSDSLLRLNAVTAAVVASAGPPPTPDHRTVRHDAATKGTLALTLPDTAVVASAELIAGARMVRARFGAGFPAGPRRTLRMSELGFFEPVDSVPADLDAFGRLARASGTIGTGSKLGLFWELYGSPARGEELTLDVEIVREGVGWLRRAGERIGLINRSAHVAFGWRESPRLDGITPRALVVDLRDLDPGTYRIEVRLTPDGETPLVASRRIEVTR